MNPGFPPPPPPDDEAADPLLRALRQRLGDYGQAPPPGAWAAIRQRVSPPPPPRPWRRQLLAALGLLVGCLLPGKLSEWTGLRRTHEATIASHLAVAKHASSQPISVTSGSRAAYHSKASPAIEALPPGLASRSSAIAALAASAPAPLPQAARTTDVAPGPAAAGRPTPTPAIAPANEAAHGHLARASVAAARRPGHLPMQEVRQPAFTEIAAASHASRKHQHSAVAVGEGQPGRAGWPGRGPSAGLAEARALAGQPASAAAATQRAHSFASRARQARAAAAATRQATSQSTVYGSVAAAASRKRPLFVLPASTVSGAVAAAARERGPVARPRARFAKQVPGSLPSTAALVEASASETGAASEAALAANQAAFLPDLLYPAGPLGLLAPQLPRLLLPAAPLATLVARPDSALAAPPVRRWALLLVAGPTISYRTLGPGPALAAGHPDFARLERPALGLGAQVQGRRVLSGRWALAVGLGYQEYATRLALSLKDSAYTAIHQRDTYRLLTVPVQASYALGAPKSRLTKALLLGAEPGWYLGGRSTEGSGCGCEQQPYSSAASSPYRPLTVAFSLGLDLRYRLGGAGSRWQWLVQPTGRYVATPFVRRNAVGFTPRQPVSLGLLTGFSWDVR